MGWQRCEIDRPVWAAQDRKDFGLIAKSIDKKEDLRQSGYLVMDLSDFRSKIR